MKLVRIAMSSTMILVFGPMYSYAQTKQEPKLTIWIEELSERELKCGLRKEAIKTSAILVLRRNGINARKNDNKTNCQKLFGEIIHGI